MNDAMLAKVKNDDGFIAALDQSGGSTPKALKLYGVEGDEYSGEDAMFDLVHQMRTRIVTSPSFGGDRILGAIVMHRQSTYDDHTLTGFDPQAAARIDHHGIQRRRRGQRQGLLGAHASS